MSAAEIEATDEEPIPRKVLRTVTPGTASRENAGMNAIGWGLFLGLVIVLVPLLPFLVIVWLITKVLEKL